MTARDRLVLAAVAALAILGAVWVLLVSPERKTASKLATEVSAANAQLATAQGEAANARLAQARYSSAYTSVVNLGKAVPPSEEVPSLIYQLAQATNERHVEFNSITAGAEGAAASSSAAATPTAVATSFTQMPFTFVFNGSFSDLYHLFLQLNKATVRTTSGGLQVSGRLLTLQGVKLEPNAESEGGAQKLNGTITATAYVLPAEQGLTAGATASSPAPGSAATTASSTTTSTTSTSSSSSPTPAATVEAAR